MTRWWVSLPYATFGIAAQDDRIVEAPPIARWTIGKPVSEVLHYFRRKGALVYRIGGDV
jgi:hypothetical protein